MLLIKTRQAYFLLLLSALLLLAIFVLTHLPQGRLPRAFTMGAYDELGHAICYAALTALLLLGATPFLADRRSQAVSAGNITRRARRLSIALCLALILVATVDELTQPLFGRQSAWRDFGANVGGIAFVLLAFTTWAITRPLPSDSSP